MPDKRELGQYYTQSNPFGHQLFYEWLNLVPKDRPFLEPFAGSNNIPKMIKDLGYDFKWVCYDINPPKDNAFPDAPVCERDTLDCFPIGYHVIVTNPPYLGKSSARRRHIDYKWDEDDLYKVCLSIMLKNCPYVAAIIPESFVTAGIHTDKLFGIISLGHKMFDDTDCPVCLALFTPDGTENIKMYSDETYLGLFHELKNTEITGATSEVKWVFNDKNGNIGVKTVDSNDGPDCKFFNGELISPDDIKISSRAFTRISGLPDGTDLDTFLANCNNTLKEYRQTTKDVMMTSFKGLRKDGLYRRRLDFKTVRHILDYTLKNVKKTT